MSVSRTLFSEFYSIMDNICFSMFSCQILWHDQSRFREIILLNQPAFLPVIGFSPSWFHTFLPTDLFSSWYCLLNPLQLPKYAVIDYNQILYLNSFLFNIHNLHSDNVILHMSIQRHYKCKKTGFFNIMYKNHTVTLPRSRSCLFWHAKKTLLTQGLLSVLFDSKEPIPFEESCHIRQCCCPLRNRRRIHHILFSAVAVSYTHLSVLILRPAPT